MCIRPQSGLSACRIVIRAANCFTIESRFAAGSHSSHNKYADHTHRQLQRRGKNQDKIAIAQPGDTILVSGNCSENLAVPVETARITIDGQGKTVITAPAKGVKEMDGTCIDRLTQ